MSNWQQNLLDRLPPAMRADPKKTGVLAILSVAMVGIVLKQFVLGRAAGPQAAEAAAVMPLPASNASAARPITGRGAENSVSDWIAQPIKTLDRNLFEFKAEFFPRVASTATTAARVIQDELFWDQLAKSMSARADFRKQKQIRMENLQLAAGKLRLQSTIMGSVPRALIDGRMMRLGSTIEIAADGGGASVAFKLVRIEARRIVVERDGIQVEVPMGAGKARVLTDGD